MTKTTKKDKKRTIIEIPIKDYKSIQKYALKYNLSFSSAIIMLALKSMEYEKMIDIAPAMLNFINKEMALEEKEKSN